MTDELLNVETTPARLVGEQGGQTVSTRQTWFAAGSGWPLLPLRLVIGYGFAAHGYAKLARGPANFATILAAIGVPLPEPMAWLTSLVELVGGALLISGTVVSLISLPLAVVMLNAMFGVHLRYGFSSIRLKAFGPDGAVFGPVGYEINLLYVAGLVALALSAASPFSVDRWLQARVRTKAQDTGSLVLRWSELLRTRKPMSRRPGSTG